MNYEEILMAKAAWFYYHEDMTQLQISELLGLSRVKVIKLLERAKQAGVIQFRFRHNNEERLEAEQRLAELFSLKDCFVVPPPVSSDEANENVAKAASMYIGGHVSSDTFINIGYGDTISHVLNHLSTDTEHTLSCVSLTGGVSHYLPNVSSSVFNAHLYLIPTPLLVSSGEVAAAMKAEKTVQDIFDLVPLSSLSVVGVGAINDKATVLMSGILTDNDFLLLRRNGAVGDILGHFIDKDGVPISTDLETRTISTSLETLKSLKNVIGVAAGESKVQAVLAALRGGYLDVLITDEPMLKALLEQA